jgi:photosynthetic reaction center H subunit
MQESGAFTGYIDVAQVALYVFWGFFFGLIFYLRREDKREGYPLVNDRAPYDKTVGFPGLPKPKTFLLPHGGSVTAPRVDPPEPDFKATPIAPFPGSAMTPTGNPLLSGAGPAAYALRHDVPDLTDDGQNRVVPLSVANDHYFDPEGPDIRGMAVVGADGVAAGTVADAWIDRSETVIRYVEVALTNGGSVLLPMPLARVDEKAGKVLVASIMGEQFADAPRRANRLQVTLREEDQVSAFFASGHLYADPMRSEPLI